MTQHRMSYLKTTCTAAVVSLMCGGAAAVLLLFEEISTPMFVWRIKESPWAAGTAIILLSTLCVFCLSVVLGGIICLHGDTQEAHRQRSEGRSLPVIPR